MQDGRFTISSRVYLTHTQREKLDALLRQAEQDLDVVLTRLLEAYLADQPEPAPEPQPDLRDARAHELESRRRELRRLRVKLHDPYNTPPDWLVAMVAELEAEIVRLEQGS